MGIAGPGGEGWGRVRWNTSGFNLYANHIIMVGALSEREAI